MATNSSIEWTEATWNPVSGCTRVSAGCDHCYAVTMTHRLAGMGQEKYAGLTVLNPRGERHFNGEVRCHPEAIEIPLRWRKPRRIFVNSMSDLFHKGVPQHFIHEVLHVIKACPQHTFQILTKRPENAAAMEWECSKYREDFRRMPNLWLGTSVENQAAADERIPHLLRCPAAVRFLSCEPLLGEVDLTRINFGNGDTGDCLGHRATDIWNGAGDRDRAWGRVNWVIVGGESGPGARPCDIGWIRSIVGQCKAASVACFVKQLGAHPFDSERCHPSMVSAAPHSRGWPTKDKKGSDPDEWPEDLRVRAFPTTTKDTPHAD